MENLYLISGDDDYEKNKYVEKIKSDFGEISKGINYIQIDKDNIDMLFQELSTYSFFGTNKLIIVKLQKKSNDEEENTNKKEWLDNEIEDLIRTKPDSTWLVFIEPSTSKSKLYKLINECGKYVLFEKPKPYEISKWVKSKFDEARVKISNSDIEYLIELCGSDKMSLNNEILKLADYVSVGGAITKIDIDKMCIKTSEILIFDLIDAVSKKNSKLALNYLEDLLENKEPIQKIMIMITKNFKNLLLAKIAIAEKKDVATELNVKPYPAKKYTEQVRNFTTEELVKIVKDLSVLDVDSKNGKMDLKIGLQKIICM